jgi:hypothetical protein
MRILRKVFNKQLIESEKNVRKDRMKIYSQIVCMDQNKTMKVNSLDKQ